MWLSEVSIEEGGEKDGKDEDLADLARNRAKVRILKMCECMLDIKCTSLHFNGRHLPDD
jgi:hypothetical protein